MKIPAEIRRELENKIGKFNSRLIYCNEDLKNYVYLLNCSKQKYVLKIKRDNGLKIFNNELKLRAKLQGILEKLNIQNKFKITEVVNFDRKQKWILFKYYQFDSLYDILYKDSDKFSRLITEFYDSFFLPLLKKYNQNKLIPGDFSLQDISYKNKRFYFYDLEDEKTIARQMTDLYAKIGKYYVKSKTKKQKDILHKKIVEIKEFLPLSKEKLNNMIDYRMDRGTFGKYSEERRNKIKKVLKK